MIKGQTIICISTSDWERPWGSRQQLMKRLSGYNRVLFVEYQASFLHLLSIRFLLNRFRKWRRNPRKVNDNLVVFTPYPGLPFGNYFRAINRINQAIIMFSLKRVIKAHDLGGPAVMWVYTPCAADLLGRLNEKFALFHCIADFSNEKKNRKRKDAVFSMESDTARRSDIVLTLTRPLHDRYKQINPRTYFFPSAVDYRLFTSEALKGRAEGADIAKIRRPRIGLVGYLDGNILDIELLSYAVDRHPEWSFVFIGPEFRNVKALKDVAKRANVYLLGEKGHDEIPGYIEALDVCLIPYIINEFTNNVSSLKLYEYLAAGKPIVTTKLAALEEFKDIVSISADKKEFIKNISLALK